MRLNQRMPPGMATLAVALLFTIPVLATGKPSIKITSIKAGQTITASAIPVRVNVSNFTVECADVGKPGRPGQGHVHAMIDGMNMEHLTNFYCSDSFDISGAGLKPGKHKLAVTLANDAHEEDVTRPALVSFAYQPSAPRPLPHAMSGGKPAVTIEQPQSGSTVDKKFDLVVNVKNFALSCDLEGKPNVAGWGHLHVFVQQPGVTDTRMKKMSEAPMEKGGGMHGGMMSMVGMIGMPCATTVPIDLSTWRSGKAHVLVMLANNDHMPVTGAAPSAIDVTVK